MLGAGRGGFEPVPPRGVLFQLVAYVTPLGVEPITAKPYKPTKQDENERFHQTLFRFLDKQPLPTVFG